MKITNISNLFCALALGVSLMSFTGKSDKESKKQNSESSSTFAASVIHLGNNGYKVKLAVDRGTKDGLRVLLKDKSGKTYYSEFFSKKDEKYRRIFDLSEMTDGTYFFEMHYNKQKLVKQVQLETSTERVISLQ
jgi:hypothetical protein